MTDPPTDADKLPDDEAEERFRRVVGNLVNTPHKPHKPSVVEQPDDGNPNRNCGSQ